VKRGLQRLKSEFNAGVILADMRVLVIGGTGFIGTHVVGELAANGHQVAVYHRGKCASIVADGAQHILGERGDLLKSSAEFQRFAPDVVIDMILSSAGQAITTMQAFRGIAGRIVALSSGDVYRAAGVLHGYEEGPLQPVPLTEESDLRTQHQPYGKETLDMLRRVFSWLDDDYDKVRVERVVMNDRELPGTVLRLPMTYGPGDLLHRLHPYLKRMDDGRPAILIQEDAAAWRGPRGYVENVAAGIALAATSPQASGRIYNLAESEAFSEQEWAEAIGRVVKWQGSVLAVPKDLTPPHLKVPYNSAQHWIMSGARIRAELGYREPVPLEEALRRTIAWERAHPPLAVDPNQFDYPAEDAALAAISPAGRGSAASGKSSV
jgi:nucleoside-diphosphate-sugar epimerase